MLLLGTSISYCSLILPVIILSYWGEAIIAGVIWYSIWSLWWSRTWSNSLCVCINSQQEQQQLVQHAPHPFPARPIAKIRWQQYKKDRLKTNHIFFAFCYGLDIEVPIPSHLTFVSIAKITASMKWSLSGRMRRLPKTPKPYHRKQGQFRVS